ncbi:hypothetical protein M3175_08795 [Robertmurraya korlensis]|uniref:hypothetical protein n=1 Tax=Robertmurraya korlensis TaxID=519977 RepID=UPI00203C188D|nr:hypothetical protein [Robertmurraya korlensis]MCM3600826.1 hypothetical protein [Robertmurraya korlensis]
MKNPKSLFLLVLGIFIVSIFSVCIYYIKDGEFVKWSHTRVTKDNEMFFVQKTPIYFGYSLDWNGIGKPVIKDIFLLKEDGTEINEDKDQIEITPFIIDEDFGSMYYEIDAIEEGVVEKLRPVQNFKVTNDKLSLVLKVQLRDINWDKDIAKMIIEYKNFGITQKQTILFEGIVDKDS